MQTLHSTRNQAVVILTAFVLMAAGSSSEQINHPNYLVNLLKNLAAIASTQAYQDILKNANSNPISNAGNNAANGSTMHELRIRSIPVGSESLAGKTFIVCLLLFCMSNTKSLKKIMCE